MNCKIEIPVYGQNSHMLLVRNIKSCVDVCQVFIQRTTMLALLCMGLMLSSLQTKAQVGGAMSPMVTQPSSPPGQPGPVTGTTSLQQGTVSSTYTVTSGTGATSYSWTLSTGTAGTISGTGTSATLTWNSAFSGGVTVYCSAVNSLGSTAATPLFVQVTATPTATVSPTTASINYNTSPGTISVTNPVDLVTYYYQWQSSPNNSTWTYITGATATSYTPGNLTATTYYRAVLTNNNTDLVTYSNSATITVYPQLVSGSASPASQTINYNTAATLSATAPTGGSGSYTYQWQSSPDNASWSNVSGATSLSYTTAGLTATTYYRLVSTSNGGSVNSNSVTVTVYPQLVSGNVSPTTQNINYNTASATLTGTAATGGNGTYTYQWQNSPNGSTWTNISGATTTTYSPGNLTATTYYHLVSTSNGANVNSATATVTVYPQLVSSVIGPSSQNINYNNTGGMSGSAPTGGNGTYTYQWQSSPDNSTWTNMSGATTTSYTTANLTATTYYRLVSSSNGVSVNSNSITVTVYPQLVSGIVSPTTQTINYSTSPATVTATAATGGSGTYTYQWQSSPDNTTWTNISGATTTSYAAGSLTATTYYRLVSTSNSASVNSSSATVTVYPQLVSGSINLASQTINYNTAPAALTVTAATGGNGTYTYQWQNSPNGSTWTNVSGATSLSYAAPALTATTYYHLVSTSNSVSVNSGTATVTVYPQLVSGSINLASQTINYNTAPAALTVTTPTGGSGTYTYQWQNSPNGSTWTGISGATALSYTPPALTATTYFHLVSTSNGVSVNSATATATVYPQLVSGTISPATQNINYNTTPSALAVTVATGGNGTYTYQWQSSPDNITWTNISGATTTSYAAGSLTATTYYHLVSTSNGVNVNSSSATITVYPQFVSGTISPASQTINYNTVPAALTVTAATGGNGTYTYQWQNSPNGSTWTNISGATALTYTLPALTATTYYHLVSTSNGISVSSSTATVTVYPQLVSGSISPATQTIPPNTAATTLTCTPTGGNGTYAYQWQSSADNITFSNITSATSNSYSPATLATTTYYRVSVTSNGANVFSNSAAVIISDCIPLATNVSASQNYILTSTPRIPGYNPAIGTYTACDVNQTIQYFDGLGRPSQTVQIKASPTDRDLVQPYAYDQFGRETVKYLPYAVTGSTVSDGSYKVNGMIDQGTFYTTPPVGVSPIPYANALTGFESSPLNRVNEQGAPGDNWQPLGTPGVSSYAGHTAKTVYTTNDQSVFSSTPVTNNIGSHQVVLYKVTINSDQSRTLIIGNGTSNYYGNGQLFLTISKDENWDPTSDGCLNTSEEYKDKEGHVVLKRVYNYNGTNVQQLSTYYVYDDMGNLAFVLPPASGADTGLPTQNILDNLCYQYRYDEKDRLTQKKISGKGWEYIAYNQLDQPVLTQDANQRVNNQWTVTKYDAFGRVIMFGLWNAGSVIPLATLQASIYAAAQWDAPDNSDNTSQNPYGYVVTSYPVLSTLLKVNYYDGYHHIPGLASTPYSAPIGASTQTLGLLTAKKTAVLNTPADQLWDVMYYDDLGRATKNYAQHYLGGTINLNNGNYDAVTTAYNFTNAPATIIRQHWSTVGGTSYPVVTIANTYIYDHMGRKLKTWEQITNGNNMPDPSTKTLISKLDYNEIGQVLNKHLHSTDSVNFYQNVAYTYNERGWLLSSNAPLFTLQLQYNTGTAKAFNGNIMYQSWTSSASNNSFAYTYDKLNRLTSGTSGDNKYIENNINYDQMGNINTLSRTYNGIVIDNLVYNYLVSTNPTNQLQSVNDLSPDAGAVGYKTGNWAYAYDGNGNMVADNSKGITGTTGITYNLLNLPQSIAALNTTYTYDANGNKLRRVIGSATTDYINGIEYDGSIITFIQTEEGRALPNGTNAYNYEYTLPDHLGNSRFTFDSASGSARREQQDNYLPFGMDISVGAIGSPQNLYLYNKKELQTNLQLYDYGARFYDPVIARWGHIDPKAELYFQITPYAYAANTPVNAIDPDGHLVIFIAGQNTGDGRESSYWRNKSFSFDKAVMNHFNDQNSVYLDGAIGGWSNTVWHWGSTPSNLDMSDRFNSGSAHEGVDIGDLIASLKRTNGVITESIKVVAHSMGAAYAKGLIGDIIIYAQEHPEECEGLSITEYDFAAFQQNELWAVPGTTLYQLDNKGDGVVGGLVGVANNSRHAPEENAEKDGSNSNVNPKGGHSIFDFKAAISKLQPGKYKFVKGQFVKVDEKKKKEENKQ